MRAWVHSGSRAKRASSPFGRTLSRRATHLRVALPFRHSREASSVSEAESPWYLLRSSPIRYPTRSLVERFSFTSQVAFVPRGDLLDRVTVAPLTSPFEEGALVQAAVFRFEPGGRLRRHPATLPQIFAILEGSGEVSGTNGVDGADRPRRSSLLARGRGTRDEVSRWLDCAHHRG
jgi:hypothetical protein